MKCPDFEVGVSAQIVETMIVEVLDSMVYFGEMTEAAVKQFDKMDEVISELQVLVSAHLNKRMSDRCQLERFVLPGAG